MASANSTRERDHLRAALEDAVQLNPGWRSRAIKVLDDGTPGEERSCPAEIHHGPGHQSCTPCRVKGEHEIHEAVYGGSTLAQWRDGQYADQLRERDISIPDWVNEGTAMTGFFDEPPELT